MAYKFGIKSNKRIKGVSGLLIQCSDRARELSRYDMTISGIMAGVRTAKEQNYIFKEGDSQKDGYEKKSHHQSGNAIDIIPVQGGYTNDKAFRHFAACMFHVWQQMMREEDIRGQKIIAKDTYLEWGGLWSNFVDLQHWQIVIR